jgi:virginiamycin A acetyltransferase
MRDAVKGVLNGCSTLAVLPWLVSYVIRRPFLGADRALEGSSQSLALIPGLVGVYLRRAFLRCTLAHCAPSASVHFGTLFSQAGARLDSHTYVGPRCHLGLVHLERDVLLAAGVHIPSGSATHGTDRIDVAIRDQGGHRTLVRIGEGSWVGSAAVVMADVGKHCIIAAGSVVTKPIPDYAIAAGVPARVVRDRRSPREDGAATAGAER